MDTSSSGNLIPVATGYSVKMMTSGSQKWICLKKSIFLVSNLWENPSVDFEVSF